MREGKRSVARRDTSFPYGDCGEYLPLFEGFVLIDFGAPLWYAFPMIPKHEEAVSRTKLLGLPEKRKADVYCSPLLTTPQISLYLIPPGLRRHKEGTFHGPLIVSGN